MAFFNGVVEFTTRDPQTPGCLVAGALANCAGTSQQMRDRLGQEFAKVETALSQRIARAQDRGQISPMLSVDDLALTLAATARGLMLRARTGCSADTLYPAAEAAACLLGSPDPGALCTHS